MDLRINKLTDKCFTSTISLRCLINSIEDVYKKNIKEIEEDYSSEKVSEEYSEYIISSTNNNNVYIDNIVLFTKEKFGNNHTDIKIDKFIVGDGISKLIILNNLLTTKEFILKRIDSENIEIFRVLYRSVFTSQTHIPGYYLDAVLANLYSKFNKDIGRFSKEYLREKICLTIITDSSEEYMTDYIINKNIINKLLSSEELSKKVNFKLSPYNSR